MFDFKFINNISIKNKTYLLVLLSVVVALVLLFVSNNGLNAIHSEQKNLNYATDIERYTNKLIYEEQKYRLNTNGSVYNLPAANQSYNNALKHVDEIHRTLNKANNLSSENFILGNSRKTLKATNDYKKLYLQAVSILTDLNNQAMTLEREGELITKNIQEYVESKRTEINKKLSKKTIAKINNGSNIWQYTYVTRLHEKKYRLSPNTAVLNSFNKDYQFMTSEWHRLKNLSDQDFEFKKLEKFNIASQKYNAAMLRWVDLNNQLVTQILPKMKALGKKVISNAVQSAKLSVKQMSAKRSNIALTLILISLFTIALGIIIGTLIARSISSPLGKLKEQALAISDGNYETKINIQSKDEIGQLADAFNYMSETIANEMAQREVAEKAQRRSQKMDAVGQLTGGIAHDFNNLLAIMLGNLELLQDSIAKDSEACSNVKSIEKAGLRAATLTRQLLSFSRTKATQVALVDINESINEMTAIITRSLTPQIKVNYNFAEDLWQTEIDNGDLSDSLINLCINARDSMNGHGSLTIETHNVNIDQALSEQNIGLYPGQYIDLTIKDTGEGIPDDLKERIFEPFFTTKEQGKGTGLGLAMVYAFVKRSKGYIKCDSEEGVGTTFHIYLPKKEEGKKITLNENTSTPTLPQGDETILVVDDEIELTQLAQLVLEAQGYKVITALDGVAALKQLQQHPEIDLLFSDIVMPNGINGYELAEKTLAIRTDIKILLTSGYSENVKSENEQVRLNTNLINKPYNKTELLNQIRTTLDE